MAVTAVILVAVAAAAITLWQNGSPGAKAGSPDSQAATRADGSRVPYAEQIAGGSSDVASIVLPEETLLPEFWEAYGAGDAARAAAFFTEDGIWIMADPVGTSVAGGRDAFALVGRDAIEVALAHYCCGGVQPTALDLGVVGETLAGRARLGDAIHAFTAELRDGKFSSLRETLDLADPATALGYEAKWYFWQRPYSPKPSDLVVSLEAADDSGPVGRVLLSEASAGWPPAAEAGTSPVDRVTQVHIDVEPGTGGVHRLVHQPVRIHIGSCSDLGPVIHPLASIVDGTSDSLVSARVDDLLNGERSVALYKSDEEPEALIACGNLTDLT